MTSYMQSGRARACFLMFLVVLLAVACAVPASGQTDPKAKIVLRPLTNDDVSAYKLPATTQRSGGLDTIGLGQPAYLDALVNSAIPAGDVTGAVWTITRQPAGSKAVLEDSPLGAGVKLFEPADQATSQLAGRKLLRPDVPGRYRVSAAISIVGVGTVTVTKTFTGATYVGAQVCAGCHSIGPKGTIWSISQAWSETGHAHIFEQGIDGKIGSYYGKNCLGCHTVGYDANNKTPNGGFSAVATAINWVFPALKAGNFDALPAELKNLGNIQCENCHGPGSRHVVLGGDTRMISKSYESGTCNVCHSALSHHYRGAEWMNSRHAVATSYPTGAGREACVRCHAGPGFIDTVNGVKTPRVAYSAINCMTCHEPHGRTTPEKGKALLRTEAPVKLLDGTVVKEGGAGLLCMNCHQSRANALEYIATTAGYARFGPHYAPQADMLAGTNAYTYGKKIPSSAHGAMVKDSCVSCHMQEPEVHSGPIFTKAGGHTFNVATPDGTQLVAVCQKCHGPNLKTFNFELLDYNDDGVIEGIQTEVQRLLDELALLLPPVGKPKTSLSIDATWTRQQLQAGFNYKFVNEDRSKGIHNTAFTVGLLQASIDDLKKK